MDKRILIMIRRVYAKAKGPVIIPTRDGQDRQYWLAAMGMYETLSIMGISAYYNNYRTIL